MASPLHRTLHSTKFVKPSGETVSREMAGHLTLAHSASSGPSCSDMMKPSPSL